MMSGGTFEYKQYSLRLINDIIKDELRENGISFDDETIVEIDSILIQLDSLHRALNCLDKLFSGDISEENFLECIKKERK